MTNLKRFEGRIDDANTVELLQDSSEKSQVLLMFTTSGKTRQLHDLCLNADLLQREGVPEMIKSADVLIYDNAGTDVDGIRNMSIFLDCDNIFQYFFSKRLQLSRTTETMIYKPTVSKLRCPVPRGP